MAGLFTPPGNDQYLKDWRSGATLRRVHESASWQIAMRVCRHLNLPREKVLDMAMILGNAQQNYAVIGFVGIKDYEDFDFDTLEKKP